MTIRQPLAGLKLLFTITATIRKRLTALRNNAMTFKTTLWRNWRILSRWDDRWAVSFLRFFYRNLIFSKPIRNFFAK